MPRETVRVLGVDPALRATGLGVVEESGRALRAVEYGVVVNPPPRSHSEALLALQRGLDEILARAAPDAVAIESPFFSRNARTAIALGEARGVVLAACAARGVPVHEYAPREVKRALTGRGAAEKDQVARMVSALLGLREAPEEDAADALAVAVCHCQSRTSRALGLGKRI